MRIARRRLRITASSTHDREPASRATGDRRLDSVRSLGVNGSVDRGEVSDPAKSDRVDLDVDVAWQPRGRVISFDIESHRFDLRAAAIVISGQRVLLHRRDGDSFWALPGGRVEAGETAELAVVRELQEELAESIYCDRLIFVIENFFSHGGVDHHEVGMYFSAALEASSALLTDPGPFDGSEGDAALTFAWFDRRRLDEIDVRPSFLVDALGRESLEFRHVVHRDRRAYPDVPAHR